MSPDFTAVAGSGVEQVVGALLTIVLILAVATVIVSGIGWAIGQATGNWQVAAKGRAGVLAGLGAGVAAGLGVAWLNDLLRLGETL